jgi:hypothetical protein
MDSNTAGVLGAVGLALSIAGTILTVINHKRVRSGCCGKKIEVSLDVEATTPPKETPP